jgi:hypothetical protein
MMDTDQNDDATRLSADMEALLREMQPVLSITLNYGNGPTELWLQHILGGVSELLRRADALRS